RPARSRPGLPVSAGQAGSAAPEPGAGVDGKRADLRAIPRGPASAGLAGRRPGAAVVELGLDGDHRDDWLEGWTIRSFHARTMPGAPVRSRAIGTRMKRRAPPPPSPGGCPAGAAPPPPGAGPAVGANCARPPPQEPSPPPPPQ